MRGNLIAEEGYLFQITRKIMWILITEVGESRAKMIYLNLFYLS